MLPLVYDNWSDSTKTALNEALARYAQAVKNGEDGVAEDVAFHETLVACSNNAFIRHYAAMIRGFFSVRRVTVPLTQEQKQLTLNEHTQIVSFLNSGDLVQAQRILHRHLSRYVERGIVSSDHRP